MLETFRIVPAPLSAISLPKTWLGSNVPRQFNSKTNLTASFGRSKNDKSGEVVASFLLVTACAVDQHIDSAVHGIDFLFGRFQALLVKHVRLDRNGHASTGFDFFGNLCGGNFIQVKNGDSRPSPGQRFRHSAAQNAASAGDYD
jgi:hypothetical protein